MSLEPTRIALDSAPSAIADLSTRLSALFRSAGLDDSGSSELTSAVVEAVNNCIEHAYSAEPGHPISLHLHQAGGMLDVEIRDRGLPLPPKLPPDTLESVTKADADTEGGWGWFIIKKWTDGIDYVREADENVLTLSKRLTSGVADA